MDDWIMDRYAYDRWTEELDGSNKAELERVKRILPMILDAYCTDTQKVYIAHYYGDQMTMSEIAARCGVNKSVVSRAIRRGLAEIYRHLQFCSPLFMDVPITHRRLDNGRGKRRRSR